ncbi:MAG: 2-phosphosulfolactate phosphatase [Pirellulales bacterium]|nr:2-phosphosulfolactate phosphatase [Pirellulales bacterium]
MRFDAYLLPRLVRPQQLRGAAVVVVDVLRATTTIATALAAGARRVVPTVSVSEARRAAQEHRRGRTVLGGERRGLRIPGFALGNSPGEYTAATVGGSTVVFTTTNGTRALARCRLARHVLLAALVNVGAVCSKLAAHKHWHVVCAGTRGEVTCEDVLLAGMLWHVWRALHPAAERGCWNDQAELAACMASTACGSDLLSYATELARGASATPSRQLIAAAQQVLEHSAGGRNLVAIGLSEDIAAAVQIDLVNVVPVWKPAANEIIPARPDSLP